MLLQTSLGQEKMDFEKCAQFYSRSIVEYPERNVRAMLRLTVRHRAENCFSKSARLDDVIETIVQP